jgi:hypothetical protein
VGRWRGGHGQTGQAGGTEPGTVLALPQPAVPSPRAKELSPPGSCHNWSPTP